MEKTRILELAVDTQPTWECYCADEGYNPTVFGIAKHKDLIVYEDYGNYGDVMANIVKHEAPPVSVMRKFVREGRAQVDGDEDRDRLADRREHSEDPNKCSTQTLQSLVRHYHAILMRKSLSPRPK
ncbi:hypothetical protein BJX62DRAFT_212878 [Aspergillus germanicus]